MTLSTTLSVPIRTTVFVRLIDELRFRGDTRDPVEVVSLAIEEWIAARKTRDGITLPATVPQRGTTKRPWRDDLLDALIELGGEAHRRRVIDLVFRKRSERKDTLPVAFEATVQRCFQDHCSQASTFRADPDLDLFRFPRGKGAGIWGLNHDVAQRYLRWREKPLDDLLREFVGSAMRASIEVH